MPAAAFASASANKSSNASKTTSRPSSVPNTHLPDTSAERRLAAPGPALPLLPLQRKLSIGAASDPLESEADAIANKVMSGGNIPAASTSPSQTLCRKCACEASGQTCAKCEEEKKQSLQRKVATSASATADHAEAPPIVHDVLRSPGQPLDGGTRSFMESRFGYDLTHVRVHTDGRAAASARAVQAMAYTSGRNIVFDSGRYQPHNRGDSLLAHELAHVIQQSSGEHPLRRKLAVLNPDAPIADPTGKGLKQSNAATIGNYLGTLCAGGAVKVDAASGQVDISSSFCNPAPVAPDFIGPPAPSASNTGTQTGCGCICDIVTSKNQWKISVDDNSWPHTDFDDHGAALGNKPGGSGGTVTAPSPNSTKLWGAETVSGKETDIDPWLVLGHELCGHAWMGNTGSHAADEASPRGEGGHQETVKRENLLRAEHGMEARGSFKDPNCGESFFRDKANPAPVNWSSYWSKCQAWRDAFNKANGTNFKMTDRIP
jgi:hypothetical protein